MKVMLDVSQVKLKEQSAKFCLSIIRNERSHQLDLVV